MIKRKVKNIFASEGKELLEKVIEDWVPLFEEAPPKAKKLALDIEVFTPFRGRVPSAKQAEYPIISVAFVDNTGFKKVLVLGKEMKWEEIPEEYGADLFISIHADSNRVKKMRGTSVYCLSLKGASDEAARCLADKENASDLIGGIPFTENNDLNFTLLDLALTNTINSSLRLGALVLREVKKVYPIIFWSSATFLFLIHSLVALLLLVLGLVDLVFMGLILRCFISLMMLSIVVVDLVRDAMIINTSLLSMVAKS